MTRHYFKTKEQHERELGVTRERQNLKRRTARLKLEKTLQAELRMSSMIDEVSKLLATKV